jgi:hypothetical protein
LHILKYEDLEFRMIGGSPPLAELIDLRSGTVWGPVQPFALDIYSLALQRTEAGTNSSFAVTTGDGWIDVTLTVDDVLFSASATVRFALDGEGLVARIAGDRLQEPCPERSLLAGITLLPGLLSVGPQPQRHGHLVLPYRSGALCFPERHGPFQDRFLVYGEQRRWELMPMLPCLGAVRTQTQSALLAIVEQGECDAECQVETNGCGGGSATFSLRYRYTPIDPVDPIERVVRFVPLRGAEAGYAGMGRRMHQFVLAASGRGTLMERAAANPDIAYAGSAFVLKIMHACKDIGSSSGDGALRVFTTFDQAAQQLRKIKSAGIERLYVQLTGWNLEGHDGRWPTRFPVEPAVGGEAGMRALIACGQALGYQMQVHDNYIDLLRRSPEFEPNECAGSIYGGPLPRGCWAGGINYLGWALSYPEEQLSGQMEQVKALGVSGMAYLDAMGVPLEVSYNPQQGAKRYRRACADGVRRVMHEARRVSGAAGIESGYLYGVAEADYVGTAYCGDAEPSPSALADVPVPLWHMAVKGHAICILHDTFNAAVDFGKPSGQTVSRRMLTMAEHGLLPRNEIVAVPGGWGYPLEPALGGMKLEYDLMVSRLDGVALAALTDHEVLERNLETGTYVSRSHFSNGAEVVCDYSRSTLQINGRDYPLPNDFVKQPAVQQE